MSRDRANRARLREARAGRAEIEAAEAAALPPLWMLDRPDLVARLRNDPRQALIALTALQSLQADPALNHPLVRHLIADIEALIGVPNSVR